MDYPTITETDLSLFNAKVLSLDMEFSEIKCNVIGMIALNQSRHKQNLSDAYTDEHFFEEAEKLRHSRELLDHVIQRFIDTDVKQALHDVSQDDV